MAMVKTEWKGGEEMKPIKIKITNGEEIDGFVDVMQIQGDRRDQQPDNISFDCYDEDGDYLDENDYDCDDIEQKILLNMGEYCDREPEET